MKSKFFGWKEGITVTDLGYERTDVEIETVFDKCRLLNKYIGLGKAYLFDQQAGTALALCVWCKCFIDFWDYCSNHFKGAVKACASLGDQN